MSETRIPEALALLREKGWCKGRFHDNNGAHCLHGALLKAHRVTVISYRLNPSFVEDGDAIQRVVLSHYAERSLAAFNDDPETTFADVEFVLEKAILERGGAL